MRLPRGSRVTFQHRGQGFLPPPPPGSPGVNLGTPFLRKEERAGVHEVFVPILVRTQMTRCSVQGPRIARSHCWL